MKRLNRIFQLLTLLAATLVISCEDTTEYERYSPAMISQGDNVLTYTNVESYPTLGTISSSAPTVDFSGKYSFTLGEITGPAGSTFVASRFSIDSETGIVSYNNSNNTLSPGTYKLDVGLATLSGVVLHPDAVTFVVAEVPITVTIDKATVDVGALEQGVIATVSYTDNSGGAVTSAEYSFTGSYSGFSINSSTGEISKTQTISDPTIVISVTVLTNLGSASAADILTVNVGPAPTINYVQADGATDLTGVTVSPWTAYSTHAPDLQGMEAGGGFTVNLPAELENFSGSISVDAQGVISIAADAGLPDGAYSLGVTATTSGGISADFDDVFTLTVATVWDETAFTSDNFGDKDIQGLAPEEAYPGVWANYTFGGSNGGDWRGITDQLSGSFDGFRRFNPYEIDAGLVRTIDLTGVKALRFTFEELVGYGGAFLNNYDRALYFGEDLTNAAAGSFVESDWNTLLGISDGWLGINWNGGNGPPQPYNNLEVDLSQVSGNTLHIMWRLMPSATSSMSQNGQYVITSFEATKASAYAAVEE